MHLLRMLVALCLNHNIVFKAFHIAGKRNAIADALSRLQIKRFKELAPKVDFSQHQSQIIFGSKKLN